MNSEFVTKELQIFDLRWEIVRYEIKKISIEFSKLQAQNTKKEKMTLENKPKRLRD